MSAEVYSAALSYIRGEIEIEGDLRAAVAFKLARPGARWRRFGSKVAGAAGMLFEHWFQSRRRAAANIQFHYDRPNDFYKSFLDSRLVYSCAYFERPDMSLDQAQEAKLDLICRKLALKRGEHFLDVGCGWGALIVHAAREYGAIATGCTLSRSQVEHTRAAIASDGLAAEVLRSDYRDLAGKFDKIASVGMFEHVGRARLAAYFRAIHERLKPGGSFLNHGIIRPAGTKDGPETRFLRNHVFPGGELAELPDVIRAAEAAGFEVVDVENLRPHYALTCAHWVRRLKENSEQCLRCTSAETWRVWMLYLAASALSFERGETAVYQILMSRRGENTRPMTRDYMYGRNAEALIQSEAHAPAVGD